jgi:sialic acid synthase SpsE
MIGWIYSDPENLWFGTWRDGWGQKISCAPARPANAAKRSVFVNYDIERGQSFDNEVIRVTRSELRPS